jgi:hypothetical protein
MPVLVVLPSIFEFQLSKFGKPRSVTLYLAKLIHNIGEASSKCSYALANFTIKMVIRSSFIAHLARRVMLLPNEPKVSRSLAAAPVAEVLPPYTQTTGGGISAAADRVILPTVVHSDCQRPGPPHGRQRYQSVTCEKGLIAVFPPVTDRIMPI